MRVTRDTVTVGLAGITRAAVGGMLATALAVFVGRRGPALAVSLLSAAFFFSSMVFTPLWGVLGDLTGRRRALLVATSACTTLAAATYLVVQSVWGIVALRAVYAVFAVAFGPLMLSVVGAMSGSARRGRASGFLASVMAAGDVLAQLSVGVLLGLLAPSTLFALIAAVSTLGTVALVAVRDPSARPQSVATDPGRPGDAGDSGGGDAAGRGGSERGTNRPAGRRDRASVGRLVREVRGRLLPSAAERRVLRRTGLTWLYVALAVRHLAVKGVGSLVPIFLLTRVGTTEAAMGVLLTVSAASQIPFNRVFGGRADRGTGGRRWLVVFGMAVSGLYGPLLAGAATVDGPVRLVVAAGGFVAVAAGFSAMDLGAVTVIAASVPAHRESAFVGLRGTAAGAGGVVGPVLIGSTVVLAGFRVAFLLAGVLAALAAVVVWVTLNEPDGSVSESFPTQVETAIGISRPTADDD